MQQKGEKILVLGGGESGVGAALLAQKKGYEVMLSDAAMLKPAYKEVLLKHEIKFEEGKHSDAFVNEATLVIKSPGIPPTAQVVQGFVQNGIPILSEIEWASRFTNAKLIGVTGSNGKTTTVKLLYHLLKSAGIHVALAGNVGESFACQLAKEEAAVYVLELSSFQLEDVENLSIDIALLLNISPDHLDRYAYKMENYLNAKLNILRNSNQDSICVFNFDDALLKSAIINSNFKGGFLTFGESAKCDAYWEEESLRCKDLKIAKSDLQIVGKHNWYNTLSVMTVAKQMGLANDVIAKALKDFKAVEHRLEKVASWKGMTFRNDSKATNVDATFYALDGLEAPIIWIAGGVDKGNEYTQLLPLVKAKVKALICLGKDNQKLQAFFDGIVPVIKSCNNMHKAIDLALELGAKGDTVLLSPACASFDLFKNYEDRGNQFKNIVQQIINK